jgi:hypothetical protein
MKGQGEYALFRSGFDRNQGLTFTHDVSCCLKIIIFLAAF